MTQRLKHGAGPIRQGNGQFFDDDGENHDGCPDHALKAHGILMHDSGQPGRITGSHPPQTSSAARRARQVLAWAVSLALLLALLPRWFPALSWLAWPQVLMASLAHELGHGLAALLSGARFDSLRLYADGSGVALTRSAGGNLQRALIAAGGPLGPPLAGWLLFLAARRAALARAALALIALLLVIALLFWVRNVFGWCWVALCAATAGALARWASALWQQVLTCLVAVELCLSRLARFDYLFSRSATTGAGELASDTAQMAALLGGTHWFWGALVALLSAGVMATGLWLFVRTLRLPQVD